MITLSSLVPNAADLLEMEIEELGGILLVHLNSCNPGDCAAVQRGEVNQNNFFEGDRRGKPAEYGGRQQEVDLALTEAWAWLKSECLLVEKPGGHGWLLFSRRARLIKARNDVASYVKAHLLPKRQIHPVIAAKVYPAFLRGEYDTAIFQALREVEVAVRQGGQFPQTLVGDKLMRAAFAPGTGPLCDKQLPAGEQEAMGHLFAGAFGLYRNSTAHRYVPTQPEEAAEVIMFASQLLRIVDRLKP
jgi:uncharacterized protein (TIGR02391 family)